MPISTAVPTRERTRNSRQTTIMTIAPVLSGTLLEYYSQEGQLVECSTGSGHLQCLRIRQNFQLCESFLLEQMGLAFLRHLTLCSLYNCLLRMRTSLESPSGIHLGKECLHCDNVASLRTDGREARHIIR